MRKIVRPFIIIFGLLLIVCLITGLELYFFRLQSVDIVTRFLILGILTVNSLALVTLMFFVGKNLFRLYMERQHKILGYKFRTKLMSIFGILILIPSIFLFVVASGLASNYLERIFSPQLKEPLNKSVELARAFYDLERQRTLAAARQISSGAQQPSFSQVTVRRYRTVEADSSDIVKDAFNGKEGTEVVTGDNGDIIRAAVPENSGTHQGVLVVETLLPKALSERSEKLKDFYEDYLKLESFKVPLGLNFILILGFVTLMMVFIGLWVSLKISRGITVPIQSLAMATEKIASGDLDVHVAAKSEDEIGLLINSFNQMVTQIKDSKVSLEKAYEESDKRRLYLENILQNINSGVLFLDSSGRIVTVNAAASSILNVQSEDVVGKDYNEFIKYLHSEDVTNMVKSIEGTQIRGVAKDVKISIGGRIAQLRIYVSGIRESYSSKALGILVVFDDLTELIKAQKVMAWQEMARRLAHEIKNPLTPIKLSTERLMKRWQQRDKNFDAVFEKSTSIIISEVESLRRLVDVFSRYGRMPEIQKAPADIAELLDTVVSLFREYGDVQISVTRAEGIPPVSLDAEQFKRVLINIMDNAIKVMNGKGSIDLLARVSNNALVIDIADTGPGIRDAEKEKLFLPYFSKTRGGTGLGLAIASKIVGDHGGRILVRDNEPHGSVFTIEVPIG